MTLDIGAKPPEAFLRGILYEVHYMNMCEATNVLAEGAKMLAENSSPSAEISLQIPFPSLPPAQVRSRWKASDLVRPPHQCCASELSGVGPSCGWTPRGRVADLYGVRRRFPGDRWGGQGLNKANFDRVYGGVVLSQEVYCFRRQKQRKWSVACFQRWTSEMRPDSRCDL